MRRALLSALLLVGAVSAASPQEGFPVGPINGQLVAVQVFTTPGAATYTRTAGAARALIQVVGGGASGASAASPSASQFTAGDGGPSGGFCEKFATVGATESYTVGAGGTAPSAGGNNGNAGGQSVFGTTPICTANGGSSGALTRASAATINGSASITGGTASGGDINIGGAYGGPAVASTATNGIFVLGGKGADGPRGFGSGGYATNGIAGAIGVGYGCGGSGASQYNGGGALAGGAGCPGAIVVYEYR